MKVITTKIQGCYRVQLDVLEDERGHFVTLFDRDSIRTVDPTFEVQRVNRSMTRRAGTIRGFHYQRSPMAEAKMIQCLAGAVFDVCIDLRSDSPTYLQWVGLELSDSNQELVLIPKGFAHGFQALTENCLVEYFTTGEYSPPHEAGLRWNDPALAIAWPRPCTLTSKRDAAWPLLGPSIAGPHS